MDKVLVAMSGGIDSSIAAYLLKEQGYEVIGLTYINYIEDEDDPSEIQFVNDARHVADFLGIRHVVADIREPFKTIVNNFVMEYFQGHTPNPCVVCNPTIKWNVLLEHADLFGACYVATGHYAIKNFSNGRFFISKGIDPGKDQSYFLYRLPQQYLERTLFPLGQLHKAQIREIAQQLGLTNLVVKRESYDVCFIRSDNYRDFIKQYSQQNNLKIKPGPIIDIEGRVVGRHNGIMFYTIGQRRGLGIALGYPAYVVDIDARKNLIVVGPREALARDSLMVASYNLMKYAQLPQVGMKVSVKIRYRDKGVPAIIKPYEDKIQVIFDSPAYGVTPGQSAVFYEDNDVVGGGIII